MSSEKNALFSVLLISRLRAKALMTKIALIGSPNYAVWEYFPPECYAFEK